MARLRGSKTQAARSRNREDFLLRLQDAYEGTRLGRQEIHAELLEDVLAMKPSTRQLGRDLRKLRKTALMRPPARRYSPPHVLEEIQHDGDVIFRLTVFEATRR